MSSGLAGALCHHHIASFHQRRRLSWDKFLQREQAMANGKWWQAEAKFTTLSMRWRVPCRSWFILAKMSWTHSSTREEWWRKCNYPWTPPRSELERAQQQQQHTRSNSTAISSTTLWLTLTVLLSPYRTPFIRSLVMRKFFSSRQSFHPTSTRSTLNWLSMGKLDLKCDCKFHLIFGNLIKFKFHSRLTTSQMLLCELTRWERENWMREASLLNSVWLTMRKVLIDCQRQDQAPVRTFSRTMLLIEFLLHTQRKRCVSCYRHTSTTPFVRFFL